jgi:ketosteroid isomerase-like protein
VTGPVRDEVLRLDDRRYEAMLAGDVAALGQLLSERLVYTHTDARVDTKQGYLAFVGARPYARIDHAVEHVIADEQVVLIRGTMEATVQRDGIARELRNATLVAWVNEGGTWRLAASQPTPIP